MINFVNEPDERLRCPICKTVFNKPWQTSCGHRFCKLCLESLLSRPDGFTMTEEGDDGHSTVPILPAETATNQASSSSHTEANTCRATEQGQLMGTGANQANRLNDAVVRGAVQTAKSSQSNQPSEPIAGPKNWIWQSRIAERGGRMSDWHLADITVYQTSGRDYPVMGLGAYHVSHNGHAAPENVYRVVYSSESAQQINGLSGSQEEEPVAEQANGSSVHRVDRALQASDRSYVDNDRGDSYRPNGTVGGEDLPYPIPECVTCLPVQEQGSRLTAMPCFLSVGHVRTPCSVSNAGRTALCYQQLIRNFDWQPNLISSTENIERAIEHTCTDEEIRNWKQKLTRTNPQTAALKRSISGGTFFIMEIGEVSQHLRFETPILSDAVYSYRFERLMGIRIYPNGVGSGRGTHVAIFIHMMESAFDDLLDWPYAGTVTVSVQDRSGSTARSDISRIIQAKPYLSTFQQPHETICRTGYGYERFAPMEEFFGPRYVKDDKLLLKIEFSG